MILNNDVLKLSSVDLNNILQYDNDINKILKIAKKELNQKFKKIIIPKNVQLKNLKCEYNSLKELIEDFYSYGENENLYPYFGFDAIVRVTDVPNIIKDYLTNNLSVSLNTKEDNFDNSVSINLKITLDGEEILTTSDYFNYSNN